MSDIHVFLSNVTRNMFSQLEVLTEGGLQEFFNPDGEEEMPVKTWEDLEESDGNYRVVKLPLSTLKSQKWLIVHDVDCETVNDEEPEAKYHLTDEDPIQFIRDKFIKSREACNKDGGRVGFWGEKCTLTHKEDDIPHVNLTTRYCTIIWGPGDYIGLRLVDANETYPFWEDELPADDYHHEHSHIVFFYDTSRL